MCLAVRFEKPGDFQASFFCDMKNPVLKYYGGKFRLAKWVISYFPAHEHYVEPFGGGASVLLQKSPSKVETYNDADGDVVNFFQTLRESPDELIRQITLTPWARDEFTICLKNSLRRMENARRLYFRLWMSRHGGTTAIPSNWRRNRRKRSPVTDVRPDILRAVAERLRTVQIENRDALSLIAQMDSPDTLFYVDPPYPAATRTDKNRYAVEMNTKIEHQKLAGVLMEIKGCVIISGYSCDLYTNLFERNGWRRVDKTAMTHGGVKRVESLWLSPRTVAALAA